MEFVNIINFPCCVIENKCNEYVAEKNLTENIIIISNSDFLRIETITIISLSRLIVGGAAMFVASKRNHHIDIWGAIIIIPFVKYDLRVWVIK